MQHHQEHLQDSPALPQTLTSQGLHPASLGMAERHEATVNPLFS